MFRTTRVADVFIPLLSKLPKLTQHDFTFMKRIDGGCIRDLSHCISTRTLYTFYSIYATDRNYRKVLPTAGCR